MTSITYSFSKYFDVLGAQNKLLKRYLPNWRHIIFADAAFNNEEVHFYNENAPYSLEYVRLLEPIDSEFFLYLQDDFWLYAPVNTKVLEDYQHFLAANPQYSFVKLLKSGQGEGKKVAETLFEASKEQPFSMQATIWRKDDLLKLYTYKIVQKMREECNFFEGCNALGIKGVYHFDNEPKRGQNHHDSSVFPYTATAIVQGQWNFREYPNELKDIGALFDIDYSRRKLFL